MAKQYASTEEAVAHLYRRIADDAPCDELMEIVFDQWGDQYGLRPPILEVRVALACGTNRHGHTAGSRN
jgi:hypothetical protein